MCIVKNINIGKIFYLTWVFRHKWEKDKSISNYTVWEMKKRLKLGVWYEKNKVVGSVKKEKHKDETIKNTFNESNHINKYMIGLDLIVCKTWVDFTFKPTFKIKI